MLLAGCWALKGASWVERGQQVWQVKQPLQRFSTRGTVRARTRWPCSGRSQPGDIMGLGEKLCPPPASTVY